MKGKFKIRIPIPRYSTVSGIIGGALAYSLMPESMGYAAQAGAAVLGFSASAGWARHFDSPRVFKNEANHKTLVGF